MDKNKVLMNKYEIGRLLGKGTFAKVYYARNMETSQSVAIKVIDKEKVLKVSLMDQIKREISVMRLVRHPNIVQLYEVLATKTKIYFILEYLKGGELFNKVAKGKLKEEVARKYFQQLINALDYCHSRGVYHRDLKPENILLDEDGNIKISDFGLSALAECKRQDGLLHTTCGTPAYVAPEVISRGGYNGAKADIWSCGVILFVLLACYLPFHDKNLMEMYRKIGRADYKCPNWFSPDVKRLLQRMLDPNPISRISIARIKASNWFKRDLEDANVKDNGKGVVKSDPTNSSSEGNKEDMGITNINAFNIISLSTGFDLSALFEESVQETDTKFLATCTASTLIAKLEEVAKRTKFKVTKKDHGVLKMERNNGVRMGLLEIDVEIFELAPTYFLVEINKINGNTSEYQKIWREEIRPQLDAIISSCEIDQDW